VSAVQLTCGVAGPVLDVFFLDAGLRKEGVVATKAVTQVLAHGVKILWFARGFGEAEPAWLAVSLVGAVVGTRLGSVLLRRFDEQTFRRWTGRAVLAIGAGYLVTAAALLYG
jgi:uncharacterized membrane protein YfcA